MKYAIGHSLDDKKKPLLYIFSAFSFCVTAVRRIDLATISKRGGVRR